ncbi:hypothetical protein LX81_04151 [Palleronia aestuarii]|uniref:Uncharacterized protein n=1 Tax=Palleronia aestuarii TaxID=568105 RepID=A0A2W7MWY0_9RHOB|nr:hypothetical protein [Palleronia aestuarii]PZX10657.1 hypothetical protein LX81_04151 [Palleronia aestuarii]
MAILVEHGPQRIHQFSALVDQPFLASEHHCLGLLLCRLRRDKSHLRLTRGDYDRLGISHVIFLTLGERPNILRHDQPGFMAKGFRLARFRRPRKQPSCQVTQA